MQLLLLFHVLKMKQDLLLAVNALNLPNVLLFVYTLCGTLIVLVKFSAMLTASTILPDAIIIRMLPM